MKLTAVELLLFWIIGFLLVIFGAYMFQQANDFGIFLFSAGMFLLGLGFGCETKKGAE